jgi:hypothetical protein
MRVIIAIPILVLLITAIPVYAISPYDDGYKHGVSDAKKIIQGSKDLYILQPGSGGWTDHPTGEFIQGYVDALNSTAGMPKDWKAGYDYLNNDWNQHGASKPGGYECPLWRTAPTSNFCLGYDAGLAYQNSDY